jgi:hypothetical protein
VPRAGVPAAAGRERCWRRCRPACRGVAAVLRVQYAAAGVWRRARATATTRPARRRHVDAAVIVLHHDVHGARRGMAGRHVDQGGGAERNAGALAHNRHQLRHCGDPSAQRYVSVRGAHLCVHRRTHFRVGARLLVAASEPRIWTASATVVCQLWVSRTTARSGGWVTTRQRRPCALRSRRRYLCRPTPARQRPAVTTSVRTPPELVR